MKTAHDPRHQERRMVIKSLFAESFTPQSKLPQLAKEIMKLQKEIDEKISAAAPAWPIDKLNKIIRSIDIITG